MEEEIGLVSVTVVPIKVDPDILDKLFTRLNAEKKEGCTNPYQNKTQVKTLMRHNIWTVDQFADISGFSVSTITNMARPGFIGNKLGSKLDVCFPFPDSGGRGPKFILRNEKSEKYIKL
jgi:hypothetical protein